MRYQGYKKLNKVILVLLVCFGLLAIIGLIQAMDYFKKPNYIGIVIILAFLRVVINLIGDYRKHSIRKEM